jgi:hypothetical protein
MHDIDTQILQIDNFLKGQNVMGSFVTNDEFTSSALGYYLGQPVVFSLRRNIRDVNVPCAGEPLFFTKNFDVFMNNSKYAICRWNS